MWCELLKNISKDCQFAPPASDEDLAEIEQALKLPFPEDLASLLKESNGESSRTTTCSEAILTSSNSTCRLMVCSFSETRETETNLPFQYAMVKSGDRTFSFGTTKLTAELGLRLR
jgi:hypothetical protein